MRRESNSEFWGSIAICAAIWVMFMSGFVVYWSKHPHPTPTDPNAPNLVNFELQTTTTTRPAETAPSDEFCDHLDNKAFTQNGHTWFGRMLKSSWKVSGGGHYDRATKTAKDYEYACILPAAVELIHREPDGKETAFKVDLPKNFDKAYEISELHFKEFSNPETTSFWCFVVGANDDSTMVLLNMSSGYALLDTKAGKIRGIFEHRSYYFVENEKISGDGKKVTFGKIDSPDAPNLFDIIPFPFPFVTPFASAVTKTVSPPTMINFEYEVASRRFTRK